MNNIIGLLQDKNYHLQRFHDMNEAELANFVEGKFENLEVFYNTREAILDLIKCIDRLIEQANLAEPQPGAISAEDRQAIIQTLAQKNDLVNRILAQDLQILSVLETTKSGIIKELAQVRGARKAVGAYHSGDSVSKLDEEA